jgi:hypothetical protein
MFFVHFFIWVYVGRFGRASPTYEILIKTMDLCFIVWDTTKFNLVDDIPVQMGSLQPTRREQFDDIRTSLCCPWESVGPCNWWQPFFGAGGDRQWASHHNGNGPGCFATKGRKWTAKLMNSMMEWRHFSATMSEKEAVLQPALILHTPTSAGTCSRSIRWPCTRLVQIKSHFWAPYQIFFAKSFFLQFFCVAWATGQKRPCATFWLIKLSGKTGHPWDASQVRRQTWRSRRWLILEVDPRSLTRNQSSGQP